MPEAFLEWQLSYKEMLQKKKNAMQKVSRLHSIL